LNRKGREGRKGEKKGEIPSFIVKISYPPSGREEGKLLKTVAVPQMKEKRKKGGGEKGKMICNIPDTIIWPQPGRKREGEKNTRNEPPYHPPLCASGRPYTRKGNKLREKREGRNQRPLFRNC